MSTSTEGNIEISEQYEMEQMLPKSERVEMKGNGDTKEANGREDNKVSYILS